LRDSVPLYEPPLFRSLHASWRPAYRAFLYSPLCLLVSSAFSSFDYVPLVSLHHFSSISLLPPTTRQEVLPPALNLFFSLNLDSPLLASHPSPIPHYLSSIKVAPLLDSPLLLRRVLIDPPVALRRSLLSFAHFTIETFELSFLGTPPESSLPTLCPLSP